MKIIVGNLWDSKDDLILVTANSYINSKGELVMGRGAALELKIKFPKIAYTFGKMIKYYSKHLGEYNVLVTNPYATNSDVVFKNQFYGIFQVKYHFKDSAKLDLIERSVSRLNKIKNNTISMNFPGIGFGNLSESSVMPIIEKLSDNVTIYKK